MGDLIERGRGVPKGPRFLTLNSPPWPISLSVTVTHKTPDHKLLDLPHTSPPFLTLHPHINLLSILLRVIDGQKRAFTGAHMRGNGSPERAPHMHNSCVIPQPAESPQTVESDSCNKLSLGKPCSIKIFHFHFAIVFSHCGISVCLMGVIRRQSLVDGPLSDEICFPCVV